MHFIFGYVRAVPVKIEKKTSIATLVAIGILIVFLFIFLSFEDLEEPARPSELTFHPSWWSEQLSLSNGEEIDWGILSEQGFWTSELRNFPRLWRDLQSP